MQKRDKSIVFGFITLEGDLEEEIGLLLSFCSFGEIWLSYRMDIIQPSCELRLYGLFTFRFSAGMHPFNRTKAGRESVAKYAPFAKEITSDNLNISSFFLTLKYTQIPYVWIQISNTA